MKCTACDREIGVRRTCPYCDAESRWTFSEVFKNETKVLIKQLIYDVKWKSVVILTIIGILLIAGMVTAGIKCHDFGLMQCEALRRHSYWIVALLFLCAMMVFSDLRSVPAHTVKGRILKWIKYYGFPFTIAFFVLMCAK